MNWHVAVGGGSALIYSLKDDGRYRGKPQMVNDVMIRIENANGSAHDLSFIVKQVMRGLDAPADPVRDALVEALIRSGNALSVAAQTTGGTPGRDDGLVQAIDGWNSARADLAKGEKP